MAITMLTISPPCSQSFAHQLRQVASADAGGRIPIMASGAAPTIDLDAEVVSEPVVPRRKKRKHKHRLTGAALDRQALTKAFPEIFQSPNGDGKKRPLKVGIHQDLYRLRVVGPDGERMSRGRIFRAVKDYVSGPRYARGMVAYDTRIDLEGSEAGNISAEARRSAIEYLDDLSQKRRNAAAAAAASELQAEGLADA